MALTVNTNIINDTDQYLLDAKNVKGTYIVVASIDDRDNLPTATLMSGTLCYCQEDSKIYQCTKSANTITWEEKIFGELNTNAFSKINVGGKTVSADSSEDTVTLTAGSAITLTADENSDTITISSENSAHLHSEGVGLAIDGSNRGGVSAGFCTYKAKLRDETALYVDSAAATTTSGRVYPVAVDKSGYLAVNVPWEDTVTTDTNQKVKVDNLTFGNNDTVNFVAGTGISISADTSADSITISSTITDNDKKTSSGDTDSKIYLVGATSQSTSGVTTYSHDQVFVDTSHYVNASGFNASSDKRLKENIKEYKPQKSVLDLPIVEFDFIESKAHQIGCLAQDLQEICPEIVTEDDDGYLRIQESKIVYLLLEEVKKLKQEVEELKKKAD